MQTPLPLLIAVLGLAASAALAQEASPAAVSPAKSSETSTDEAKAPEKKAGAAASSAEVKKAEIKPAPTPAAKSKSTRRVAFGDRTTKPDADDDERPRSFWGRLFFRHRRPETSSAPTTPAPVTPAPKATPRPHKTMAVGATPAPRPVKPKTVPAPKPVERIAENATPDQQPKVDTARLETTGVEKTVKATPAPKATPAAKAHTPTKGSVAVGPAATPSRKAPVAPSADADADAQEKYRYEMAKKKALEDAEVLKLKEKADGATSDDEARKAQRAYNKALFNKMRSIDGSIKDRADRIEAAIMKRLDTPE